MVVIAEDRRRLVCGITDELFNKNTSIRILDAGAGTGIGGEMVRQSVSVHDRVFSLLKFYGNW